MSTGGAPDEIEKQVSHRPWPMPDEPWVMFQSWRRLLFAHWPLPSSDLRPFVPPELALETFDGSAWIGITPFQLCDLQVRPLPPLPGVSSFPELNLRTYVRRGDRPGIFFFSLDAGNRVAVAAARTLYRLPYFHAEMSMEEEGDWIRYRSRRGEDAAHFVGRYRPTGRVFTAEPGSLEHFLTERYALYTVSGGTVLRGDIHHPPWPLQTAEADIERNTVAAAAGIALPPGGPLLHYSERQDTIIWLPRNGDESEGERG